jgi:hypothetical protein
MPATCPPVATAAKNAYLVYKITLLQSCTFTIRCKYTLTKPKPFFMKYLLILLVFPMLSATDCGKKKSNAAIDAETAANDSLPVCLRQMIDKAKNDTPPTIPIQIDEYRHQDKKVYYVTADCCDFFNIVYTEDCKYICAPGGGFTGKGDNKCPDFFKEATLVRTIWKKEERKVQ